MAIEPNILFVSIFETYSIWTVIVFVALLGVIFVLIASIIEQLNPLASELIKGSYRIRVFLHHLLRDVGIALIIAAVVTGAYEVHARSEYDRANFKSMLDTIMGEIVPPEIWKEVKSGVLQRDRYRTDVHVRLKLRRNQSLEPYQAELHIEYSYYLKGLNTERRHVTVVHTFDNPIESPKANLPRFERVVIGDTSYNLPRDKSEFDSNDKRVTLKDRKVTLNFDLDPRNGRPVLIVIERCEEMNLPGEYKFVLSELTQGIITLIIDELPDDLPPPDVEFITDHADKKVTRLENRYVFEGLMLPGQSINILFAKAKSRADN